MEIKVGDHVAALRSHNKAVRLVGTVTAVGDEEINPAVVIRLDDNPEWYEAVHRDDVELLEGGAENPAGEDKPPADAATAEAAG